ncbi:Serine carboxypeptidase-like 19 [Zea mays]|uniref:Serine carboxypeptidase-like 19 n=1 Tax=Zea mays TaxID=4577 RepID=A0A1D6H7X8_MAIZE|nr:Serine carboxypeptidase-like 19 [Zea mays]
MPRQRTLTSEAAGGRLLLVVVAVLLCLSVPLGRAAPPGAEVAEFPGFTGKLPSKHYAGYDLSSSIYEKKSNILCRVQYLRLHCIHTISSVLQTFRVRRYVTVGQHEQRKRHLYYYLAVSERNPSLDPVVIWINGGPACSGFSAFLHSFGPFRMEGSQVHINDGPRVAVNPYSWTKMASLLLVDSPAGVGYSYADHEDDYTTDDTSRVADLYDFLSKWFAEYAEFLSNPFYVAGCSYSGVIVPVLAHEIIKRNEESGGVKINFKVIHL